MKNSLTKKILYAVTPKKLVAPKADVNAGCPSTPHWNINDLLEEDKANG
jgi:hypothetical protein